MAEMAFLRFLLRQGWFAAAFAISAILSVIGAYTTLTGGAVLGFTWQWLALGLVAFFASVLGLLQSWERRYHPEGIEDLWPWEKRPESALTTAPAKADSGDAQYAFMLSERYLLHFLVPDNLPEHCVIQPSARLRSSADAPIEWRIESMTLELDGRPISVTLNNTSLVMPPRGESHMKWGDVIAPRAGGVIRLGFVLAFGKPGGPHCRRLTRQAYTTYKPGTNFFIETPHLWNDEIRTEEAI